MHRTIEITDWLDHLDDSLTAVNNGETVTITRNGHPVAQLGPQPGIEPEPEPESA